MFQMRTIYDYRGYNVGYIEKNVASITILTLGLHRLPIKTDLFVDKYKDDISV